MSGRASILSLLALLPFLVRPLEIAFNGSPSRSVPAQLQRYPELRCNEIPLNQKTGSYEVDDVIVRTYSDFPTALAFYSPLDDPRDNPCSTKNLQIIAIFAGDKNIEQTFSPIYSRLSHWKEVQPGTTEWDILQTNPSFEGDVLNRSGSGWYVEAGEVQIRRFIEEIQELQVGQNTPGFAVSGWDDVGPEKKAFPSEDSLKNMDSMESRRIRAERRKNTKDRTMGVNKNPDSLQSLDIPSDSELLELMREKEATFLKNLPPKELTDYVKEIGSLQNAIKKMGGYMPVPIGIRDIYAESPNPDAELKRLGFNILPAEEKRADKARKTEPESYFNGRFAGMGRRELPGNIVPTLDDWDSKGGVLSMNTVVASPKRIRGKAVDDRDLNSRLARYMTYHELWRLYATQEVDIDA